jgi:hypothetical protein
MEVKLLAIEALEAGLSADSRHVGAREDPWRVACVRSCPELLQVIAD